MTAPLRLSCPTCRQPLGETLACANGHRFRVEGGVLVLLDADFERRLRDFEAVLGRFRQDTGRRLLDPAVYEGLPFSLADRHFEWKMRCHDLAVATRLVGGRPRRILDVGAWNGWLSHRLAKLGHDVTAADYFTDPYDGLGAHVHYEHAGFRPIQLDLDDLSALGGPFDAVIVNRCLAFFSDPLAQVEHVRDLLAPGALLLLTGLAFFRNPRTKAREVADLRRDYRERYGAEIFLRPTKGYLDGDDRRALERRGVTLRAEWRLARANLEALVRPTRPFYCHGVYRKPA